MFHKKQEFNFYEYTDYLLTKFYAYDDIIPLNVVNYNSYINAIIDEFNHLKINPYKNNDYLWDERVFFNDNFSMANIVGFKFGKNSSKAVILMANQFILHDGLINTEFNTIGISVLMNIAKILDINYYVTDIDIIFCVLSEELNLPNNGTIINRIIDNYYENVYIIELNLSSTNDKYYVDITNNYSETLSTNIVQEINNIEFIPVKKINNIICNDGCILHNHSNDYTLPYVLIRDISEAALYLTKTDKYCIDNINKLGSEICSFILNNSENIHHNPYKIRDDYNYHADRSFMKKVENEVKRMKSILDLAIDESYAFIVEYGDISLCVKIDGCRPLSYNEYLNYYPESIIETQIEDYLLKTVMIAYGVLPDSYSITKYNNDIDIVGEVLKTRDVFNNSTPNEIFITYTNNEDYLILSFHKRPYIDLVYFMGYEDYIYKNFYIKEENGVFYGFAYCDKFTLFVTKKFDTTKDDLKEMTLDEIDDLIAVLDIDGNMEYYHSILSIEFPE